ncbi:GNAT family N-acetyltransferase [Bacillus sp. AK031]
MNIHFEKLLEPTPAIVEAMNRWENDPVIIPLTRPNKNQEELERREKVTLDDLTKRLANHRTYIIYLDNELIGEMNYMVDPGHLFKKEAGTAWIGITIGEPAGRGKGIGRQAIQFLERQIKSEGLSRIELGVFEFNQNAMKLYKKMGYKEIGYIENFTYWEGKMWTDIRMEKHV